MAKKKPARHSAVKKSGKKTVKRSGPQKKTAQPKTVQQKPPAMKVAVRVTREPVKSAKPKAKSASSRPDSPADLQQRLFADLPAPIPMQPVPMQPESQCQTDAREPVAAGPSQFTRPISHDEIRHRAYLKWEAAGRPPGDGGHFWAEAERELSQQS